MFSGVMKPFVAYLVLMCCLGAIASPVSTRSQLQESQSSSEYILAQAYFTVGYKPDNWKLVFKTNSGESFFYIKDSEGHVKYSKDEIPQISHPFLDKKGAFIKLIFHDPKADAEFLDESTREVKKGLSFLDESEEKGAVHNGPDWVKAAMAKLIDRQSTMQDKKPFATVFDDPAETVKAIERDIDYFTAELQHFEDTREKNRAKEEQRLAKLARQGGVKQ
ncbi:hypothetical protein C8R42DRAFT_729848 [Lentinula raphanica]|nr:hypothetical protein C8R42DRAFT_729848 [Lentinula raphanica]